MVRKEYVINPLTGRTIQVGGVAYQNAVHLGKIPDTVTRKKIKTALKSTTGRGSATSGWRAVAPRPGKQRHRMAKNHPECFLMPKEEKFPICAAGSSVKSCKGINAAYVRARQWGYMGVAKKARSLQLSEGCRKRKRRSTKSS